MQPARDRPQDSFNRHRSPPPQSATEQSATEQSATEQSYTESLSRS